MKKTPRKQPEKTTSESPHKKMDVRINEFGQIVRDVQLEDINQFLDENVPDKKLDPADPEK